MKRRLRIALAWPAAAALGAWALAAGAQGAEPRSAEASPPEPPRQSCAIDGTAVNLTDAASIAGKSGLLRCKDPATGALLHEAQMSDGHQVGLVRSYHLDGRLRRVSFRDDKGSDRAVAEFTVQGKLAQLRCADQPLLAPAVDDARLCGHAGGVPARVELYDDNGVLRSRLGYLAGKRVRAESFYDNGKMATQEERIGERRVERQFSSEGIKRRELVQRVGERGGAPLPQEELQYSDQGVLVREQRWDARGEPQRDDSFYASGKPRVRTAYSGAAGQRVADVTEFHPNGQRAAQGRFLAPARAPLLPIGTHQRFNDSGTLVAESVYDNRGRAQRERQWDDQGQLIRDAAPPEAADTAATRRSNP